MMANITNDSDEIFCGAAWLETGNPIIVIERKIEQQKTEIQLELF